MNLQSKTYSIDLTLNELQLLDGKVLDKAQEIINKAKQEYSYGFDLPIMNEILRKSEEIGQLTWCYKSIKSCGYCDKTYNYHTYGRNTKYHNKGDNNYDKPRYYRGVAFNEGFITIHGIADMCTDCEKKYNVIYRLIDYIIDNDLKIEIQKNDYKPSKYIRNANQHEFILNPWFISEVKSIQKIIKQHNMDNKNNTVALHNKHNTNVFSVNEDKWNNGYQQLIVVDIINKNYYIGFFGKYNSITNKLINELKNSGYIEIDYKIQKQKEVK